MMKHLFQISLILTVLMMYSSVLHSQTYNLADKEALRTFLRQESAVAGEKNLERLGLNPSDTLTWDVDETWIANVEGLTWAGSPKQLTIIDWSAKSLKGDLDLSACSSLWILNCQSNSLSGLDLSDCSSLWQLYCSSNSLSDLDFSGLSSLQGLNCSSNSLSDLDLSGLSSLLQLDCSSNSLSGLDLSGLSSLQYLYCSSNSLSGLDLSACSSLQVLYCQNNSLSGLDLSGCSSLQILDCRNNSLSDLDLSGLSSLQWLDCSYNSLSDLDFSGCSSLQLLDCSSNSLSDLDLSGLNGLVYLSCSSNSLSVLDLSGLNGLVYLFCSSNNLSDLDLSVCSLLQILDCSYNSLSDLDLSACSLLQYLSCSSNSLSDLDFSGLNSLDSLDCSNNRLALSQLDAAGQLVSNIDNKSLGSQSLVFFDTKTMYTYEVLDLSQESEFNSVSTTYTLEKDGSSALPGSDYTITGGKITFLEPGVYRVTMENTGIASHSSYPAEAVTGLITVVFKYNTFISENAVEMVRLYPNPVARELIIKNEGLIIESVVVTDINGRSVYQANPESMEHTVNVDGWLTGTYLVRIVTEAGTTTRKVVKN